MWTLVLGVKYGFMPTPETVMYARSMLPRGAFWSAFGIGRMEFPIVAQAWLLGGHVRVGMEDNIYLEKGVLAKSNARAGGQGARHHREPRRRGRERARGARDAGPAGGR